MNFTIDTRAPGVPYRRRMSLPLRTNEGTPNRVVNTIRAIRSGRYFLDGLESCFGKMRRLGLVGQAGGRRWLTTFGHMVADADAAGMRVVDLLVWPGNFRGLGVLVGLRHEAWHDSASRGLADVARHAELCREEGYAIGVTRAVKRAARIFDALTRAATVDFGSGVIHTSASGITVSATTHREFHRTAMAAALDVACADAARRYHPDDGSWRWV